MIWQECKRRTIEQQSRVLERQQRQHRASMREAWKCRSFLGVLTADEAKEMRLSLVHNGTVKYHCYYVSKYTPGQFCALLVYGKIGQKRASAILRNDTFWELSQRVEKFTWFRLLASEPLDRSDSVIFISMAKKHARQAILMWSLCAKRLPILRDVARYIAQLVWQDLKVWIP